MCTQTNHSSHYSQACHQNGCCSNQIILSKKKKLEILNNCLNCLKDKETDIKEAIAELDEKYNKTQGECK